MKNILEIENNHESITRLVMNDQKTGNSLSNEMISRMKEAIEEIAQDRYTKIVIIAAKGNIFCAGHNLKEMTEARNNKDKGKNYFRKIIQLMFRAYAVYS